MRPLIARRRPRETRSPAPMGPLPRGARTRPRADPAPSPDLPGAAAVADAAVPRALRVGLPAFVVIAALLWYATDEAKVQALEDQVAEVRREIEDRPEFRINVLSIEGAGPRRDRGGARDPALSLPVSSFDLDLDELRKPGRGLPAVASASVRNAGSGTLAVEWPNGCPRWSGSRGRCGPDRRRRELRRPAGHAVAGDAAADDRGARRGPRGGRGGSLFEAAQPLGERLLGLVRVGERRWDVVLRDGPRILLPAEAPRAALDRVLLLHDVQELLDRDLVRIDLRNPSHMTVQLTPEAMETLDLQRAGLVPVGDERG
jgi:cell division protein FtsQ